MEQESKEDRLSENFQAFQQRRRRELWSLLGDLPADHQPRMPKLVKRERGPGYTVEHLELDLNGMEAVPAVLLIPDGLTAPAPGLLFIHWHGGWYEQGKMQLFEGRAGVQPAYAGELAARGVVTLAIDSWCFGGRRADEVDTFKLTLWRGQVLWGLMLWDELRALDYLASRPEVDAGRLGTFGMSMGATKAWWLAALDERVKYCIDLCCLTDFEELIRIHNLKGHGLYYYVPGLLKQFRTEQINELIVPRARLSLNGRRDRLTPTAGVERCRDYLLPLYREHGREEDCRIELFDCGHEEPPEMRSVVLSWMGRHLGSPRGSGDQ